MNPIRYFSEDYASARARFRAAASAADASLHRLELDARGSQGETLSIDIAWLGNPRPRRVLMHSSGLHGVEGFAGAAIQLQALAEPPPLAADQTLLLVHVLNPYGMAWLRRANESNVDLNRNFPGPGQSWGGASEVYGWLDPLLNPTSRPACDGFRARVLLAILRRGSTALAQAIAGGQHEFPRGLFYGGSALEQGPHRFVQWLVTHLRDADHVLAIDVHTGLGPWGRDSLFVEARSSAESYLRRLQEFRRFSASPYVGRGTLGAALPRVLSATRIDALTQELGTYSALRVLHALREENRWHHHGGGGLDHPSKERLLQVFCPRSLAWREAVLARGAALLGRAIAALAGS